MPFGLRNAPPTFQRFMNLVVEGIPNCAVFIDDVILYSDTYEEHVGLIRMLFDRFKQYGLIINVEKSVIMTDVVEYLGFEFDEGGYRPLEATLPAMREYPLPKDKKDIQKFLGTINYYRGHIPRLAEIAAPLYDMTQKQATFSWGSAQQEAFDLLKELFMKRIVLAPLTR